MGQPLCHPQGGSCVKPGHVQQHPEEWVTSWGLLPLALGPGLTAQGRTLKPGAGKECPGLAASLPLPFPPSCPVPLSDRTCCPLGTSVPSSQRGSSRASVRAEGVMVMLVPAVSRCRG